MDEDATKADRPRLFATRRESPNPARSFPGPIPCEAILERYQPAARRFLRGAVGDPDAADVLLRKLVLDLRRDAAEGAEPDLAPGRFRDVLRTALLDLIRAHRRSGLRRGFPRPMAFVPEDDDPDAARFEAIWREELLERTWRRLEAVEARTGHPLHTTLRRRAESPGLSAAELAHRLGHELGRPMSQGNAREVLHRAQLEFSRLLLEEVVATLPVGSSFEAIERELIATGLLAFCRGALGRCRPVSGLG